LGAVGAIVRTPVVIDNNKPRVSKCVQYSHYSWL